jgi:hypothetical protein
VTEKYSVRYTENIVDDTLYLQGAYAVITGHEPPRKNSRVGQV